MLMQVCCLNKLIVTFVAPRESWPRSAGENGFNRMIDWSFENIRRIHHRQGEGDVRESRTKH